MKLVSAALLATLLCTSLVLGGNLEDVAKFVADLKEFYTLNTFIIFLGDECLKDDYCWIDELLRMSIPAVIMSYQPHPNIELNEVVSTSETLTIIFVNSPSDPIKKQATYALEGMRLSKIIFVLLYDNVRSKSVRELFDWCSEHNMLNSAIVFYNKNGRVNVFTYNPYPRMNIFNSTQNEIKDIFPDKLKNLNGYNFRSPVKLDPPHVFKMTWKGQQIITGLAGRTLSEFVRSSNATFQEITLPDSSEYIDMEEIFKLLLLKKIDISIHPHGHFNRSLNSASYPLTLTNWCLMVPIISKIPAFLYVVLPFDESVWNLIFFEIVAVATAMSFANFLVSGRVKLGKSFCDSLKGALYLTIPGVKLQKKWQCTAISGIALFGGFIITNIYLATLTSFFATTSYGSQIENFNDLKRSGIKIMLTELDKKSILQTKEFPREEIKSLLVPVDVDTLAEHRDRLNTSFAYLISDGRWLYLKRQDDYKKHHTFRLTNICFGDFFLSYPMQMDSPFMEPLRIFIIKAYQYGLWEVWVRQTFSEAVKAGLVRIKLEPEQPVHPITFGHFTFLWYLLGIGYCAGFISFILERLFHNIKTKIMAALPYPMEHL